MTAMKSLADLKDCLSIDNSAVSSKATLDSLASSLKVGAYRPEDTPKNTLIVEPRRRKYLNAADAMYDYIVGSEFLVTDPMSPLQRSIISVVDVPQLKAMGYAALQLVFNPGTKPLEIALDNKVNNTTMFGNRVI